MKHSRFINVAIAIFLAVSAVTVTSTASALMLQVDSTGQLRGATGVEFLGSQYDVSFVEGTCISVFSGCDAVSDFTFTEEEAYAASHALQSDVFVDGPNGAFDSDPTLTYGISGPFGRYMPSVLTPHGLRGLRSYVLTVGAWNGVDFDYVPSYVNVPIDFDLTGTGSDLYTWAVWSPSSSAAPVPEPSTLIMLSSGLVSVAVMRRRMKK